MLDCLSCYNGQPQGNSFPGSNPFEDRAGALGAPSRPFPLPPGFAANPTPLSPPAPASMDRREPSTIPPPSAGQRRRPWPDADAEEASSPKRHKTTRDRPRHRDMDSLAEAEEAVARVATASPSAGGSETDEVEDGEKLEESIASVDAGRGPGDDPGDAGPASGARVPPPVCSDPRAFLVHWA